MQYKYIHDNAFWRSGLLGISTIYLLDTFLDHIDLMTYLTFPKVSLV